VQVGKGARTRHGGNSSNTIGQI